MASSSSQTVTTVNLKKYDVFISFRGEDTRFGFTSHLYAALKQKMEPYIDNMLEKGEQVWAELVEAIKDSTMFLVVFSENYASSTWCLNELVEMMECHKKRQGVVIPVFYKIDPSHVRKQKGSYGTAMAEHKKQGKNDDHKMQNWKNALSQAADLSGFHSTNYRTESEMIEDIVRFVFGKSNHNYPHEHTSNFILDENLILDENYWTIMSSIKEIDSTEVQIIGLWGMGGIGKTTLARAMFHKISFQYEGSCFLENVTEESKKHGINYMCNILVSNLLRDQDLHIDTYKAISSMIIRRLKRMKTFIVLEDMHTSELLKNLIKVVVHSWLGAGSRVIVTTRDKQVLVSGGIKQIHQVKKMNSRNSLQLFSLNAFKEVLPKEGYMELSKRAIDYAEGNPLALNVLGSFLHGKREIEWNSALAKLKEIPNVDIDRILRWSYNELDDKEKNIFLDIACFFKGHERDRLTTILNERGFFADIGISRLLDKALIRLDFQNCIQMHNLMQEMGKQIVLEECPKNPGQRSRLCDPKEVCEVLKNNRGTEVVEAIILDADEYTNIILSPKAFEKLVNLRLLVFRDYRGIKTVSLPHGLDFLPENLIYFLWDRYPLKSLPPTFFPEMLVELLLRDSCVEKLWNGEMNLPNLKRLDLSGSKKLIECPNVSRSPDLKVLILDGCENLSEVDSSIFLLRKLERLKMAGCTSLKSISSNTCSPALIEFNAGNCINLQDFSVTFSSTDRLLLGLSDSWNGNELPSSILNKTNLELFDFPLIECLVNLPQNFANRISLNSPPNLQHDPSITLHKVLSGPAFITLKDLLISDIPKLSEIPDNIYLLLSLETLELIDIGIRTLPETIKYLPRLFRLHVSFCEMLQSIPTLPLNLADFTVLDCESLETVLSSKDETKPNPCTVILLNCKKLDPRTLLNNAFAGIGLGATGEDINSIQYLLPDIPEHDREYWFNYRSPQVSFTIELPPNLLGFAFYLVHSGGLVGETARFGCECYLDSSSGERICITRFRRAKSANIFQYGRCCCNETIIPMNSDHVLLWYDPVSCKQIMEAVEKIKAINDMNNTSYNPKLTFKFFIEEHVCYHVVIKECGLRWIYKEETGSSTIFESHDEDEETVPPTIFESHDGDEETVPPTVFESHDEDEETVPPTCGLWPFSCVVVYLASWFRSCFRESSG